MAITILATKTDKQSDQLENAAGRAFRLYLSAVRDGCSTSDIAALKAAYVAASGTLKSVRGQITDRRWQGHVAA